MLLEAVAGALLALGSVLIIRAFIASDAEEAVAARRQEPPADYRRAA
jgi:hypothetical protein